MLWWCFWWCANAAKRQRHMSNYAWHNLKIFVGGFHASAVANEDEVHQPDVTGLELSSCPEALREEWGFACHATWQRIWAIHTSELFVHLSYQLHVGRRRKPRSVLRHGHACTV